MSASPIDIETEKSEFVEREDLLMLTIENLIAVIALAGTFFSLGFSVGWSLGVKK